MEITIQSQLVIPGSASLCKWEAWVREAVYVGGYGHTRKEAEIEAIKAYRQYIQRERSLKTRTVKI